MSKPCGESDESNSTIDKHSPLPKKDNRVRSTETPELSTDEEVEARNDGDSCITWDCSLCTYKNSGRVFRCLMCDTRKGTSTRKTRVNAQMVALQVARQQQEIQQQLTKTLQKEGREKVDRKRSNRESLSPSLNSPSIAAAAAACSESKRLNSDVDCSPSPGPSKVRREASGKKDIKNAKKTPSSMDKSNSASKPSIVSKCDFSLKNIDRNCSISRAVTVNNVTIIITEFRAKKSIANKKMKTSTMNGKLDDSINQSDSLHIPFSRDVETGGE